jgi:hypothetical protein
MEPADFENPPIRLPSGGRVLPRSEGNRFIWAIGPLTERHNHTAAESLRCAGQTGAPPEDLDAHRLRDDQRNGHTNEPIQ